MENNQLSNSDCSLLVNFNKTFFLLMIPKSSNDHKINNDLDNQFNYINKDI